ncbi:carboxymuconolactone decarboxylase family protein [Apibacter raozihei]|uniref:carboxymuconolactone decarboxylase family protein n=1 Tax=Apibacter raozihei TaxID=2500547 RepID=UPI000FE33BFB|nr:carboxymuconolactone decarboxylase family protein [Apibacter raozihei]
MKQYSEPSDKQFTNDIIKGSPKQVEAWLSFDEEIHNVESAIPSKYKELISIAVALTTQCPYCIEVHTKKAVEMGISQQELTETIMITAALRSGAAMGYGLLSMKFFKNIEK